LLFFLAISFQFCFINAIEDSESHEEPQHATEPLLSDAQIEKLKIKELRQLLQERGVECVGCTEKPHLVQRVKETIHLPKKGKEAPKETNTEPPTMAEIPTDFDADAFLENMQKQEKEKRELVEKLKAQGIKFSDDALKNDFSSNQFAEALKRMKKDPKKPPTPKKESPKKESPQKEEL